MARMQAVNGCMLWNAAGEGNSDQIMQILAGQELMILVFILQKLEIINVLSAGGNIILNLKITPAGEGSKTRKEWGDQLGSYFSV